MIAKKSELACWLVGIVGGTTTSEALGLSLALTVLAGFAFSAAAFTVYYIAR